MTTTVDRKKNRDERSLQDNEDDEKRMTIIEHLEELRHRLMVSAIALLVGALAGFVFLADWVIRVLKDKAGDVPFIAIEVTETLGVWMKIALYAGAAIAMPVIVYEAIMFVAPALTKQEKKYFFWLLPGVIISFVIGVVFGYFVLLPPALNFLLHFKGEFVQIQPRLGNYVSTVTKLLFWIGVVFETPVIIFFLAKMHIVNAKMLSRFRKYAFVASFILGAIITPTFDPVNQTLVALPLIILYEIGILLARIA
jgi:sec-independent protein translocase protein TatC